LRERTVDDAPPAAADGDPHALGVRLEGVARLQNAAGLEIAGEAEHPLVRDAAVRVRPAPSLLAFLLNQQQVHLASFHALRSATSFSVARPFSNSPPIIESMLKKRLMTFATSVLSPSIAQVTRVPLPAGTRVKVAVFEALNGFRNSSAMATRWFGVASMIRIDPAPTLLLPLQRYAAPTLDGGPSYERCMSGSIFSHGDHAVHRWKSAIVGKIVALGAAIVAERSTSNRAGRVTTKATSPPATTRTRGLATLIVTPTSASRAAPRARGRGRPPRSARSRRARTAAAARSRPPAPRRAAPGRASPTGSPLPATSPGSASSPRSAPSSPRTARRRRSSSHRRTRRESPWSSAGAPRDPARRPPARAPRCTCSSP